MFLQLNESYETARLRQIDEDAPRLPFLDAVRAYVETTDEAKRVKLVEVIVRTSRTVSEDDGLLPDDIQAGLMLLIERFRDFGPTVVFVPATFAQARELIKTFFF